MELGKFIMNFLSPKIEKGDLVKLVEDLQQEVVEQTIPPYKSVMLAKIWQGASPFKSQQMKRFNRKFQIETKTRDNWMNTTTLILSRLAEEIPELSKHIESLFKSKLTIRDALNYKQATILRVIDLIKFASLYSQRLFIYSMEKETPAIASLTLSETMTPAQIAWLEEHSNNFCRLMAILSKPMKTILEVIDTLPEVVYDPAKESAVKATLGTLKVDPLKLNYIPVISKIFLFFGREFVQLQAKWHLRAKTNRELMELRLDEYRRAANDEPSAANDRLVEITAENLKTMDADIKRDEERFGVKE